jgi:zinc protease
VLLVALTLLLAVGFAPATPMVETLDNGFRLIVEVDPSRPVAAFRVYIGTGAIYEGRRLGSGISHFVEHVISNGSENRSAEEIEAILDDLGNTYNAYTSKDTTCHYLTCAGEDLGRAIDVVSDFLLHPRFAPDQVETERGIILREMAMRDDDPAAVIADLLAETVFTVHPYRHRIIGYPELFQGLTRDDLLTYCREQYVPENMLAVAVGDFDGEAVLAQLRAAFGAMPRRPRPPLELKQEPDQIAPRRRVAVRGTLQRAYLNMGWRTIGIFDPDLYALDTLSYYLSGGDSSVLVRRLRDELGLVDSIATYSFTPNYNAGYFAVAATLDPANLERVEAEVMAELDRLAARPPAKRDLERVIRRVEAGEIYAQETAEGRAESLGYNLLMTGDAEFSRRYIAGIRAVTPEQVSAVVRKYFRPERTNVAILRPPVAAAATARAERRPEPARTITRTLPNGLTVVVRENHALPVVSVVTASLGGLRYETAENVGITALMAEMLTRGTRKYSRAQINERVDRLGGALSAYGGRNSFGVMAHFLAEDLDTALELTTEALFRPTFPPEELERRRRLTLAAIAAQDDRVETVAYRAALEKLFTVHPYRYLPIGTAESVSRLARADLVAFHAAHARPAGTALVVAGDVDPEAVWAQIEALTRELPAEPPTPPTAPVEPPLTQVREEIIRREQQQAIVVYGFHAPALTDPRRDVFTVLDAVLSGAGLPGGRLHTTLRGQELVYFVFGSPLLGLDPGAYIIYAGTAPDQVARVRAEIEGILGAIATKGPTEEEMARARRAAGAAHRQGLETGQALAQTIALDVIYGFGPDYWESFEQRINAVTAEQVRQLAAEMLDLQRAVIVVTTPRPAEATGAP